MQVTDSESLFYPGKRNNHDHLSFTIHATSQNTGGNAIFYKTFHKSSGANIDIFVIFYEALMLGQPLEIFELDIGFIHIGCSC